MIHYPFYDNSFVIYIFLYHIFFNIFSCREFRCDCYTYIYIPQRVNVCDKTFIICENPHFRFGFSPLVTESVGFPLFLL